jgi:phosphotransferase system enzyme I (PtsI)
LTRVLERTKVELSGIGVSPGIVVGKAYVIASSALSVPRIRIDVDSIDTEIRRFREALSATVQEIRELQRKVADEAGDEHAHILEAHVLVLEDAVLIEKTIDRVRKEKLNVDHVFSEVLEQSARVLSRSTDSYLRGRAEDVRDVGRRLLRNLLGKKEESLAGIREEVIVVAYDLSPADTASMHKEKVIGFVTDVGSRTSHTAIMARSLEIPAVVALKDVSHRITGGDRLIIDGTAGVVIINPDAAVVKEYKEKRIHFEVKEKKLRELSRLPAQSLDGHAVELLANIEMADEVPSAIAHGADGIGLYRRTSVGGGAVRGIPVCCQ